MAPRRSYTLCAVTLIITASSAATLNCTTPLRIAAVQSRHSSHLPAQPSLGREFSFHIICTHSAHLRCFKISSAVEWHRRGWCLAAFLLGKNRIVPLRSSSHPPVLANRHVVFRLRFPIRCSLLQPLLLCFETVSFQDFNTQNRNVQEQDTYHQTKAPTIKAAPASPPITPPAIVPVK